MLGRRAGLRLPGRLEPGDAALVGVATHELSPMMGTLAAVTLADALHVCWAIAQRHAAA